MRGSILPDPLRFGVPHGLPQQAVGVAQGVPLVSHVSEASPQLRRLPPATLRSVQRQPVAPLGVRRVAPQLVPGLLGGRERGPAAVQLRRERGEASRRLRGSRLLTLSSVPTSFRATSARDCRSANASRALWSSRSWREVASSSWERTACSSVVRAATLICEKPKI